MDNEGAVLENINYPSILFRLKKDYYAIGCENVASIMRVPEYEFLPEAPANVEGIFKFRDKVIPIISLRTVFGLTSKRDEEKAFVEMLEARKQDHVNWVKELSRCTRSSEPFSLAVDPHKCALGRWYDNYEPESQNIKLHLRKIEAPHRLLHEAAIRVQECNHICDECKREECLKKVMTEVQGEYMPQILQLLDETKDVFSEHQSSMAIVIDTGEDSFALIVDEVLAVEELEDVADEQQVGSLKGSRYITEIKKTSKSSRLVLMVNDERLSEIAKNYRLEQKE